MCFYLCLSPAANAINDPLQVPSVLLVLLPRTWLWPCRIPLLPSCAQQLAMRLPGRQNVCKLHFPTINNKKAKELREHNNKRQEQQKKRKSLKNVIEMLPAKQQLSSDTAGISFWSLSLSLSLSHSVPCCPSHLSKCKEFAWFHILIYDNCHDFVSSFVLGIFIFCSTEFSQLFQAHIFHTVLHLPWLCSLSLFLCANCPTKPQISFNLRHFTNCWWHF